MFYLGQYSAFVETRNDKICIDTVKTLNLSKVIKRKNKVIKDHKQVLLYNLVLFVEGRI